MAAQMPDGNAQAPARSDRKPVVSVVLATYNGSQFLEQAIQSVLGQTFPDYELIVVDDGSSDPGVKAICAKYAGQMRYVYQENRGLAAARNTGIRHAQGEFICFLDDDDAWKPEKLARQLAFMRSFRPEDNVAMVSTWLELIDPAGMVIGKQGHDLRGDAYQELFFRTPVDAPSSVMIRRDAFDRVGLHDESLWYAQDRDMWLRIARHFEIRSLNEHLVSYRVRPGSMSHNHEGRLRDVGDRAHEGLRGGQRRCPCASAQACRDGFALSGMGVESLLPGRLPGLPRAVPPRLRTHARRCHTLPSTVLPRLLPWRPLRAGRASRIPRR